MNDVKAEAGQVEDHGLRFTYPCYKDMADNNIIFAFRGRVDSDLVTHVLEMMGEKLEDENESKKVSKKLSNVMVECLTNVYAEDDPTLVEQGYDPTALLLVKKITNTYSVITGSYVPTRRVYEIKRMLDHINNLDVEELKRYYKEKLEEEDINHNGLTILGMIDLARKSRHNLIYHFKHENKNYTYFLLEAQISGKTFQ